MTGHAKICQQSKLQEWGRGYPYPASDAGEIGASPAGIPSVTKEDVVHSLCVRANGRRRRASQCRPPGAAPAQGPGLCGLGLGDAHVTASVGAFGKHVRFAA